VDEYEGIPFHRIRYFKIGDQVVWDREARLDLLTPGYAHTCYAHMLLLRSGEVSLVPNRDVCRTWEAKAAPDIVTAANPPEPPRQGSDEGDEAAHETKKAVLFSCGSFCPVHRQHVHLPFSLLFPCPLICCRLRVSEQIHMMEVAKKHLEQKRGYQVLAAVVSPTPDGMLRKKFWGKDGFLSDRGEDVISTN
jgi:hypothetical protein